MRRWLAILGLASAIVTACAGTATPSPLAASATAAAGSSPPFTPTAPSSTAAAVSGSRPAPSIGQIVVDTRLLDILPASIDGFEMQPAPDAAAGMLADPELGRSASAIAVGLVVAAGDSGSEDFASASVVQLRPGVFDDAFYTGWRQAYDEAACAPAGGVASHDRQVIGAHLVEIGVCSEGARTYHTHLAGDVLVSITAVGDRALGERVMAGLRK